MRKHMGDAVSAFELIRRSLIDFLLAGVPGHEDPMQEPHPWYVLMDVTSQGPAGSLHEPLREALASAHEAGLIADALIAASGAQAAKLWKMRESLPEARDRGRRSDRPRRLGAAVADRRVLAARGRGRCSPPIRACGCAPSATSAMATCTTTRCVPPIGTCRAIAAERDRINRIVHDIVVELGGSISAEHGIGRSRLAELEHYKEPAELAMMRAVKRALDPADIMNPGKVVRL